MSVQAVGWALEYTGSAAGSALSPTERNMLVRLGNLQQDDLGYAYVRIARLAAQCHCSEETVKRGMARLRELGLIARVRRHAKSGFETTAATVVLWGPEIKARAKAEGWLDDDLGEQNEADATPEGVSPMTPRGVTHDTPGVSPMTPLYKERTLTSTLTEESPQSPPKLAGEPLRDRTDREGAEAFLAAWPWKTIADAPDRVAKAWAALSMEERREARERLPDYRKAREREGKSRHPSSVSYLRERLWRVLGVLADGRKDGTAKVPMIFVRKDTPAFDAWEAYKRARGELGPKTGMFTSWHDGREGTWRPTLFPPPMEPKARDGPDDEAARLAEAAEAL